MLHHTLQIHAWLLVLLSGLLALATAFAALFFLLKLPGDHFLHPHQPPSLSSRKPVHLLLFLLKNLLGSAIFILGVIMALPLVPGPGLLMMIIGLSLTNFPGKRTLELKLLRAPLVLTSLNWLRSQARRPPFRLPTAPKH